MIECRSATTTTVNESEKKFHLRGITSKLLPLSRSIQNNLEMIMILLILAAVFANKVQESVFMPANGQLFWKTGWREKKVKKTPPLISFSALTHTNAT
jgi:hypothetical protein